MAQTTEVTSRTVNGAEYPHKGTPHTIDPSHTRIGFMAWHMAVSKVRGGFNQFDGTLELAEDPVDSKVSVTIEANSVDTRDENRDNHLRTNDFFDVPNHPTWTFVSTGVRPVDATPPEGGRRPTIRGTTRPRTLDAEPGRGS